MLYDYALWALAIDSPYSVLHTIFFSVYAIKFLAYVIPPALGAYFNLYFLIPRYLEKQRYSLYLFYLALTIIFTSGLITTGYYITAWLSGSTAEKVFGIAPTLDGYYHLIKEEPFRFTLGAITLAMSIKLTKNWIETKARQQALENEKLETELKFLKYQFNPHFLFNSINSIFFLIHKNPDMASASLAKFSELLRHQLYECNDQQIALDKEISYLKNFIELEKLRQNQSLSVNLNMEPLAVAYMGIAPFILMTFVENAFKHVSKDKDRNNWINIDLAVTGTLLYFSVINSTSEILATDLINYGGIGLKNVKRRLDLIYPGKYQLDIEQTIESFGVKLELQLKQLELTPFIQSIAELT
ncbi:sensor histidine kinase [Mucilaginibacter xinganensis]|uniref:Sensor histidine kinase n=1 Tax=Mucilaginibacter xinganensis TaxID=1234841 RepID=A0A223P008_9SPHI|nr:histidine kinase [Mucilaginibacter xinganensis]ASU35442.1 sensor histidine kinase [Mucilaginibacter xinganensis]